MIEAPSNFGHFHMRLAKRRVNLAGWVSGGRAQQDTLTLEFLLWELQRAGEPDDGRGMVQTSSSMDCLYFFYWIPHDTYLVLPQWCRTLKRCCKHLGPLKFQRSSSRAEAVPGRLQQSCFGARETVTPAA